MRTIIEMYLEGFASLKVGKTLWMLIALKLLIFFAIIKTLFFPNYLQERFDNDHDRAAHVMQHLSKESSWK